MIKYKIMREIEDETHRLNYRLSFDAMRGYHTSELFHKRDAIIILNSFLVCIIAVYAAIIKFLSYDIIIKNPTIITKVAIISLVISIFVSISLLILVKKYETKITKENKRYEQYRNECIVSREKLGLKNIHKEYFYWKKKPLDPTIAREGTGYVGAVDIIKTYTIILIIFSWLITGTLFLLPEIPNF